MELSKQYSHPMPMNILKTCILRNFALGPEAVKQETELMIKDRPRPYTRCTMSVGSHNVTVSMNSTVYRHTYITAACI